jgi:hypothetical protein
MIRIGNRLDETLTYRAKRIIDRNFRDDLSIMDDPDFNIYPDNELLAEELRRNLRDCDEPTEYLKNIKALFTKIFTEHLLENAIAQYYLIKDEISELDVIELNPQTKK